MSAPRLRLATRAIVFDEVERVLLVRFDFGDRIVWATPGGGIEEGETDAAALRRELLEEAGLEGFELGPLVWTRTHRVPLGGGRWDGQTERYYLVRRPRSRSPRLTWEELRGEGMTAVRWSSWRRRRRSSRHAASRSVRELPCTGRPRSVDVGSRGRCERADPRPPSALRARAV